LWSPRMSVRFPTDTVCLCATPIKSEIDLIVACHRHASHTEVEIEGEKEVEMSHPKKD
jgi:hypothetical protein